MTEEQKTEERERRWRKGSTLLSLVRATVMIVQMGGFAYLYTQDFFFSIAHWVSVVFYLIVLFLSLHSLDTTTTVVVRATLLLFCGIIAVMCQYNMTLIIRILVALLVFAIDIAAYIGIEGIADKYGIYWFRAMG